MSVRKEEPSVSLTPFEQGARALGSRTPDISAYVLADSNDRAVMAKNALVIRPDGKAEVPSVNALAGLVKAEIALNQGYRPDAVAGLPSEDLVSVMLTLASPEDPEGGGKAERTVSGVLDALSVINQAAQTTGKSLDTKEFRENSLLSKDVKVLGEEILGEVRERLVDLDDEEARGELLHALDTGLSPDALGFISRRSPELIRVLGENAHSLQDRFLRDTILDLAEEIVPDDNDDPDQ